MDDATLKSLLTADVPAADPRFALRVMQRMEQRSFTRELVQTAVLASCAAVLLWLLAPFVETAWREGVQPYASNLVVLVALMGITVALPYFFRPATD